MPVFDSRFLHAELHCAAQVCFSASCFVSLSRAQIYLLQSGAVGSTTPGAVVVTSDGCNPALSEIAEQPVGCHADAENGGFSSPNRKT